MERIALGQTGLKVSPLGMGTIQITRLDWDESISVVREVMDMGINFFDTAQGYFDSELRLGEAFKNNREDVVIITKSGAKDVDVLRQHINESLARLQTDYLDGFFFHGAEAVAEENFLAPGGLLETALDFVSAGKIKFLGFSTHKVELGLKALDIESFKVAMVPANFLQREYIDGEFMEKAHEKKVAVLAMKPFGGGRLIKPELCLKFLKQYPEVIPCPGIEKPEEMAENIDIWENEGALTDEDYGEIEEIKELLGDKFCRNCGYCLPCPQGIHIPTVTFLSVYAQQMPRDKVVTDSHAEEVEKAQSCIECGKCIERCPYDLNIPEMLADNVKFYEKFKAE